MNEDKKSVILIVDDSKMARYTYTNGIKASPAAQGFDIIEAVSQQEFEQERVKQKQQGNRIAAIILDNTLPEGLNAGLNILKQLRLAGDNTPVLFSTGDLDEAMVQKLSEAVKAPAPAFTPGHQIIDANTEAMPKDTAQKAAIGTFLERHLGKAQGEVVQR